MGQKVNPKIFRTGIIFGWDSKWFACGKEFRENLKTDISIKKFLKKELKNAGIAKIEIERTRNAITIIIHSAKPGIVIGRQGAGIEDLKRKLKAKFFYAHKVAMNVNILEVERPTLNARLVANAMAEEIEKRLPYRRVMKQAIDRVQKGGALGIKVLVGGRLNGSEIANHEKLTWGKIPLHTLRANIDYACATAHTTAGTIGVKVWIYKGDIFDEGKTSQTASFLKRES